MAKTRQTALTATTTAMMAKKEEDTARSARDTRRKALRKALEERGRSSERDCARYRSRSSSRETKAGGKDSGSDTDSGSDWYTPRANAYVLEEDEILHDGWQEVVAVMNTTLDAAMQRAASSILCTGAANAPTVPDKERAAWAGPIDDCDPTTAIQHVRGARIPDDTYLVGPEDDANRARLRAAEELLHCPMEDLEPLEDATEDLFASWGLKAPVPLRELATIQVRIEKGVGEESTLDVTLKLCAWRYLKTDELPATAEDGATSFALQVDLDTAKYTVPLQPRARYVDLLSDRRAMGFLTLAPSFMPECAADAAATCRSVAAFLAKYDVDRGFPSTASVYDNERNIISFIVSAKSGGAFVDLYAEPAAHPALPARGASKEEEEEEEEECAGAAQESLRDAMWLRPQDPQYPLEFPPSPGSP